MPRLATKGGRKVGTRGVRLRFHVKGKVLLPSNKGQLMAPIPVQENRESSSRKVVVADRLS